MKVFLKKILMCCKNELFLCQKLISMELKISEKLAKTPFLEQFDFNVKQLDFRLNRAIAIDTTKAENHSEFLMVFDSALVLFRSLFLEKGKKNYTFQNYYIEIGKPEIASKIDAYLDSDFEATGISIRTALKFIADKFVCHVDDITFEEIGHANYYMATLKNPYAPNNLANIVKNLSCIISQGNQTT